MLRSGPSLPGPFFKLKSSDPESRTEAEEVVEGKTETLVTEFLTGYLSSSPQYVTRYLHLHRRRFLSNPDHLKGNQS